MTRLCGVNPGIDYSPIRWALRDFHQNVTPRVRGTVEAETTATAYEALTEEDRAALLILNAECRFEFSRGLWTITFDYKGDRVQVQYRAGGGYTIHEFFGYYLDHGHSPFLLTGKP